MLKIHTLNIPGYEKVVEGIDPDVKLHCFVAIHNTTLGPALGGARIIDYNTKEEALNDVLRLAKAMTYKSAIAETGLGGGKSVIMAKPEYKSKELLLAFGKVIDSLSGQYIVAEDVGTNTQDMEIIKTTTPYVAALQSDKSSGDPSRFTAWGIYKGMQAVAKELWGNHSLANKAIAIQGVGNVGNKLANFLFWEGADLILSDLNEEKAHELAALYGAKTIPSKEFCSVKCDILSPCALGGIIDENAIVHLHCKAVAGSSNNQLLEPSQGISLMENGILYAPDYIINSGGIINASLEFDPKGYQPRVARNKVNHIFDILLQIFELSKIENKATSQIADDLANYNLKHQIGKRKHPIQWGL